MQLPFPSFMPQSNWRTPALSDLPDLSYAKQIGFDLETYDPNLLSKGPGGIRKDGFITGFALCVEGWKAYLPIRHSAGNLPYESVKNYVRDILGRQEQPKITCNGGYEREWCCTEGISIKGVVYDIQIAECLLNEEQDSYSLDSIAYRHIGERKDEKLRREAETMLGLGAKKAMHLLEARYVGPYAEADADKTLRTFQVQMERLKAEGLLSIFQMESELSEVIFLMRQRGVRINEEATVTLANKYRGMENDIYKKLQQAFFPGRSIDFNSGKDLQSVCSAFHYTDFPRTEAGNPSFIGDWMDLQSEDKGSSFYNPLAVLWHGISKYRTIEKIRRDYLEGHLRQTIKGRIHCQYHQMNSDEGGTRSGRMAASKPPMQGIPSRSEYAKDVRSLFLPDNGNWIKADYSQQEYRIFISLAMRMGLQGATEAGQAYIDNPNADFHQIVADMANLGRTDAKNWNFAAIYGAGVAKTAKMTRKTIEEATKISEQYHEKVPYAKELSRDASNRASQRGWIKTIGGRILHFETYEPSFLEIGLRKVSPLPIGDATRKWPNQRLRRAQTHKALNRYVQGSAADMTKLAILNLFKTHGYVPLMQVHDELDDDGDVEKARNIKRAMEQAIKLLVPCVADVAMGDSWGNSKTKVTL